MKDRCQKRYSVYDSKTEMPLIIYGTSKECAKAMGVTLNSFYRYLIRVREGKIKLHKWLVYEDEVEDLEEETEVQETAAAPTVDENAEQKVANEKRLIDANALKELVMKEIRHYWNYGEGGYYLAEDVVPDIDNAPTVDAAEVVHGRWEYWAGGLPRCPVCGYEYTDYLECKNYCGNCGAKMDGGNEDV